MNDENKIITSLSALEQSILKDLCDDDSLLSFNNKAMVQVENPHKGIEFFGLGDEVIKSLQEKKLIELIEKGTLKGGEKYQLSALGKTIASHLTS